MTLNKIISNIRTLIKQHTDDSLYSDEFLYEMFKAAWVGLVSMDKYKISENDYNLFCMELEPKLAHQCGTKEIGCETYRSKDKLPAYIDKNKGSLKIRDIGGTIIDVVDEEDLPYIMLDDIRNKKYKASLINGYVVVWKMCSKRPIKNITVEAVWQDLTEWADKQCSDCDCVDVFELEVIKDMKVLVDLYKIVLDLLRLPLTLTQDDINNLDTQ